MNNIYFGVDDTYSSNISINRPSIEHLFKPIDDLINSNQKFILIIDGSFINNITLSDKIKKAIKNNLCIIVINTSTEPSKDKYLSSSLNNLATKYKLNKNNFKVLSGNLIENNLPHNKYDIIPYLFFMEKPFFIIKELEEKSDIFLTINDNIKKFDKKILCYNRRPHSYRKYVFYELYHNKILKENCYLSLNTKLKPIVATMTDDNFKELSKEMINFYNKNKNKNWNFDNMDSSKNLAFNFDYSIHKKTFLSLVTETCIENEVIFFSEKIFKPIYACQPFVICGNPNSLKKLREIGFKTFNNWWDESYDSELDFIKRFDLIKKILLEISLKNDEELIKMLSEMKPILKHNYHLFMNFDNQYFIDTFSGIFKNKMNININIKKRII